MDRSNKSGYSKINGRCPHFRYCGFTLIELMLTVAILAGMMAIIYGVLQSTIAAADKVEEINASSEIGPTIMSIIRRDLEEAILIDPEKEYFWGRNFSLGGDADRLDFVTTVTSYGLEEKPEGAVYISVDKKEKFYTVNEAGYQARPNDKEAGLFILYRREQLFYDDRPLEGGKLTELYDRVKSFNLQYYDGTQWLDDWNNVTKNKKLPQAVSVKLIITIREGDTSIDKEYNFSTIVTME